MIEDEKVLLDSSERLYFRKAKYDARYYLEKECLIEKEWVSLLGPFTREEVDQYSAKLNIKIWDAR